MYRWFDLIYFSRAKKKKKKKRLRLIAKSMVNLLQSGVTDFFFHQLNHYTTKPVIEIVQSVPTQTRIHSHRFCRVSQYSGLESIGSFTVIVKKIGRRSLPSN